MSAKLTATEPASSRWFWGVGAILLVVTVCLPILRALGSGDIGPDDPYDDTMRFVQLRDWFGGQGWFDVDQRRLGLDGGTKMHWSRLVDLPIAGIAWLLSPWLETERALEVASTVWPPMLGGVMLAIFTRLGGRAGGRFGVVVGAVFGAVFTLYTIAFMPGRIDHHNIQAVLLAGVATLLIFPLASMKRTGVIAGVGVGLSLAIGTDILVFNAMICAFVALIWAVSDTQDERDLAKSFGLALAATVVAGFVVSIDPSRWGQLSCDQISPVFILAAVCGGGGLFGVVRLASGRPLVRRLAALLGLGIVCVGAMALLAPQCLSNPLGTLPEPVVDIWLSNVGEAKSFAQMDLVFPVKLVFVFATPIIAVLLLLIQGLRKGWSAGPLLLLALVLASAAFALYQVRYVAVAWLFSALAMTYVLAGFAGRESERQVRLRGRRGAIAPIAAMVMLALLLQPRYLAIPAGLVFFDEEASKAARVDQSLYDELVSELATLEPGFIMAPFRAGPRLLRQTEHRVLASNYHRNVEGLAKHIDIALSEPVSGVAELVRIGINAVAVCPDEAKRFENRDQTSLFAALSRDDVPAGLTRIHDGRCDIYAVVP